MADLSKIVSTERSLEIKHPSTGAEVGLTINLMGMDDPRMKKIKTAILDKHLKANSKGSYIKANEVEDNGKFLIFSAMTGWNWHKDADGDEATFQDEKPEFNRRNVYEVFDVLEWVKDQIDEFLGEGKEFFSNSKPI